MDGAWGLWDGLGPQISVNRPPLVGEGISMGSGRSPTTWGGGSPSREGGPTDWKGHQGGRGVGALTVTAVYILAAKVSACCCLGYARVWGVLIQSRYRRDIVPEVSLLVQAVWFELGNDAISM